MVGNYWICKCRGIERIEMIGGNNTELWLLVYSGSWSHRIVDL